MRGNSRTFCKMLLPVMLWAGAVAEADAASPSEVSWQAIVGNPIPSVSNSITNNTIGGIIFAGTDPWSTRGGSATVDLMNSHVTFSVKGLVFAANTSIGTPGGVTNVEGALVCGLGSSSATPTAHFTREAPLSAQGNASFTGFFTSSTAACNADSVAFLIVNATNTRWIAYGAVRKP
jgi:hypothetical protein